MTNQSTDGKQATTDQILDLLLDALLERNATRRGQSTGRVPPPPAPPEQPKADEPQAAPSPESPKLVEPPPLAGPARVEPARPAAPPPVTRTLSSGASMAARVVHEPRPGDDDWQPLPYQPSIHLGKTIGRLAILVAVLAVLINIPFNHYGDSLARAMPDSASIVIRNGTVLKGSGPEIYRLEDNKLRWISSLDAFDHLGLTWADVHVVEDKFLAPFEKGQPIHLLLKCETSPHIYALENGQKRWIKDIDTFTAQGYHWEDIQFASCQYLRELPDGLPIPEDAGEPPQP